MPDERASPSGGWRDVYREMGVDPNAEENDPVDLSEVIGGERPSLTDGADESGEEGSSAGDRTAERLRDGGEGSDADSEREEARRGADGDERPDASIADG